MVFVPEFVLFLPTCKLLQTTCELARVCLLDRQSCAVAQLGTMYSHFFRAALFRLRRSAPVLAAAGTLALGTSLCRADPGPTSASSPASNVFSFRSALERVANGPLDDTAAFNLALSQMNAVLSDASTANACVTSWQLLWRLINIQSMLHHAAVTLSKFLLPALLAAQLHRRHLNSSTLSLHTL